MGNTSFSKPSITFISLRRHDVRQTKITNLALEEPFDLKNEVREAEIHIEGERERYGERERGRDRDRDKKTDRYNRFIGKDGEIEIL